jgi:hypothetical protein
MTHLRVRRLPALTLTAGLVALCVAACGSSSSTSSTSSAGAAGSSGSAASATASGPTSGAAANRTKIAACLKAHGVTLPARPGGGGRRPANGAGGGPGFFFGGGGAAGGRFANNPKLRAAVQACGGGRGFGGGRRTLSHAAVTKFVACVKQHGYNLPSPNFSGKGPIFPASISKNSKFQAAARICQADLRPAGAPGPGGPPGSGTATTSGA